MAKGTRGRRGIVSRQCRPTPYSLPSYHESKTCPKIPKKDWEDSTCSVCMECPHNAVLLLCSSHEKGCRPYMCGTSFRYSNCLDQYKNAYTKTITSTQHSQDFDGQLIGQTPETTELACPLCRGQVKGWTVVKPAREYLNGKKRSCMQDNCAFVGTFRELRKHMRAEHPLAKPHEVDPKLVQKWSRMEREREREDVMSTIRSSMPGPVFFGDYVIEGGRNGDFNSDDEEGFDVNEGIDPSLMSVFLFLQAFGSMDNVETNRGTRDSNHTADGVRVRLNRRTVIEASDNSEQESDDSDDNGNGNSMPTMVGRLRRRRRHREASEG